jgi:Cu-Zn family superoxide dismutase
MRERHFARFLTVCLLTCAGVSSLAVAAPAADSGPRTSTVTAVFTKPGGQAQDAYTYAPDLVPEGSGVTVTTYGDPLLGGTSTALAVDGLRPDREYGAHAHSKPCGATGDAAGPHFQHVPDPVQPSVDPAYANPENEIWLDFTTNGLGNGYSMSDVDWTATDQRAPKSVVIHEMHTHTGPGEAGMAGARLACVNLAF